MGPTIVNLVVMARLQDWLFEHVVVAADNATHPDLHWLANIMSRPLRPNVMMVVDRLCSMPEWAICDFTHSVADGRMYWHLMLRPPVTPAIYAAPPPR